MGLTYFSAAALEAILILFSAAFTNGGTTREQKIFNDKLQQIRQLSKDAGLPQVELNPSEVCLDDGCLTTALNLLSSLNTSVDPCKNFYKFSCGGWVEKNPTSAAVADRSRFAELEEKIKNITLDILREPLDYVNDPHPLNSAKDFFHACKNKGKRERLGVEPIRDIINEFGGWPLLNPKSWNASGFNWLWAIGEMARRNLTHTLLSPSVTVLPELGDWDDRDGFQLTLDQPDFAIPKEALMNPYYYESLLLAYENFIFEVAQELGSTLSEEDLRAEAKSIIAFETKLAKISVPDWARSRTFLLSDFQILTDKLLTSVRIDWQTFFEHILATPGTKHKPSNMVTVVNLQYIKNLLVLLNEELSTGNSTVANYIAWRLVYPLVAETNKVMRDIEFRFRQKLDRKNEEMAPSLDVTCMDLTTRHFGVVAIGGRFLERASFDEKAKDEMHHLIKNLKSSFKDMVRSADWIKEETKEAAIAKVEAMKTFLVYPEWIHNKSIIDNLFDESHLHLIKWDNHFTNILTLKQSSLEKKKGDIKMPVDMEKWAKYFGVVNAFNDIWLNEIIFPTGLLQFPFFDSHRPKHQNYAGIGSVIGHEITHAFDNRGSLYDKNGREVNWWDPETRKEFLRRTKCMTNQYSNYFVDAANMNIKGWKTLGENIADNGGLRESYNAYQKYVDLNGPELRLPGLEAFSIDQLFFLGFANIYCETASPKVLVSEISTGVHSPAEFRVLGTLKNFNKFAETFDCPVDKDGMNPPQNEKCIVW